MAVQYFLSVDNLYSEFSDYGYFIGSSAHTWYVFQNSTFHFEMYIKHDAYMLTLIE